MKTNFDTEYKTKVILSNTILFTYLVSTKSYRTYYSIMSLDVKFHLISVITRVL